MDLISEDIARAIAIGVNAINRLLKPVFGVGEIYAKKMRETTIDQHWGSWVRWAGGWIQLMWNLVIQKNFLLGNVPLSNREYRIGIAGLFSLAPLAFVYVLTLPFAIIYAATFFVGINVVFFLWGAQQGQASIFGSLMMRIRNNGILSGLGIGTKQRIKDTLSFGGTQFWINASGVFSATFIGVSPKFNMMKGSAANESHLTHLGLGVSKGKYLPFKLIKGNGVKLDQTYLFVLGAGVYGVATYLWALSHPDLLNVTLLSVIYVMMAAALLVSFLFHDKIGKKTIWEIPARLLTHLLTIAGVFALIAGINISAYQYLISISLTVFFVLGIGTVLIHLAFRAKARSNIALSKLRRVFSEVSRTFWLSLVIQLPLIIVRIAGMLYAEMGTKVVYIPFVQVAMIAGKIALVIAVLAAISAAANYIFGKQANGHYIRMLNGLNAARLQPHQEEQVENLLLEYRHHVNDKYWALARMVRKSIWGLLGGNAALLTPQPIRAGPGSAFAGYNHNMPHSSVFRTLAKEKRVKNREDVAIKLDILADALAILEDHLPKGVPVAERINGSPHWNLPPDQIRKILIGRLAEFVIDQITVHENQPADKEGDDTRGINAQIRRIKELIEEEKYSQINVIGGEKVWATDLRGTLAMGRGPMDASMADTVNSWIETKVSFVVITAQDIRNHQVLSVVNAIHPSNIGRAFFYTNDGAYFCSISEVNGRLELVVADEGYASANKLTTEEQGLIIGYTKSFLEGKKMVINGEPTPYTKRSRSPALPRHPCGSRAGTRFGRCGNS